MTPQHVEPLDLLNGATLARRDLALVALQELPERRALKDFCVRGGTEPIDLRFQVSRPFLGLGLLSKDLQQGFMPRRRT